MKGAEVKLNRDERGSSHRSDPSSSARRRVHMVHPR
jgi:hypothetical protein